MSWEQLEQKLQNSPLTSRILLSKARLLDERGWNTGEMNDPKNLPFYYHLGGFIQPKKVLEYGFGLGLTAACLTQNCPSIEKYVGLQLLNGDEYYSFRLGKATLKEYYLKEVFLKSGNLEKLKEIIQSDVWDLVILSTILPNHDYEKFWENLCIDGLIVIDHLFEQTAQFTTFCEARNRKPVLFETRYGVGIIKK